MEFEKKKHDIEKQYGNLQVKNLNAKFGTGGVDFIEEHLQSENIKVGGGGLISQHELRRKNEQIELVIAETHAQIAEEQRRQEISKR